MRTTQLFFTLLLSFLIHVESFAQTCSVESGWTASPFREGDILGADLSWTGIPIAEAYQINYYTAGMGSVFTPEIQGNITTFHLENLLPDRVYHWRIRVKCNGEWQTLPTVYQQFETLSGPSCSVESGWAALPFNEGGVIGVDLSWTGSPVADSYIISYSAAGVSSVSTPVIPGNQTSYRLENLLPDREYNWRIRVRCNGQWQPWPNAAQQFTTLSGASCSVESGWASFPFKEGEMLGADLEWTGSEIAEAYQVEYNTAGLTSVISPEISGNQPNFRLENLFSEREYSWRVRVKCNGIWQSWPTIFQNFETLSGTSCSVESGWTSQAFLENGVLGADLGWAMSPIAEAYQIEYYTDGFSSVFSSEIPGNQSIFRLENLFSERIYHWRIRVKCNGQWQAWPTVFQNFETLSGASCSVDSGWTSQAFREGDVLGADLGWTGTTLAEAYQINYYSTGMGSVFTPEIQGNITTYRLENLLPEREYFWRIRVKCDGVWQALPSVYQQFETLSGPSCSVESGWMAVPFYEGGVIGVDLSWTGSPIADSYIISYSTAGESSVSTPVIPGNQTSYRLENLLPEREYNWRIRVRCNGQWQPWPNAAQQFMTIAESTEGQTSDHEEYLALKALFESTNGENWINNDNWPYQDWPETATSEQFATWFGITVSDGDVEAIELQGNNLKGILPAAVLNLETLSLLNLNDNEISGLSAELSRDLSGVLDADLNQNYLDFEVIEKLYAAGLGMDAYSVQKTFLLPESLKLLQGEPLEIHAVAVGENGMVHWLKRQDDESWQDVSESNQSTENSLFRISESTILEEGIYRWEASHPDFSGIVLYSTEMQVFIKDNPEIADERYIVPSQLKETAGGGYKAPIIEQQFYLNEFGSGDQRDLFQAPPCLDGLYYAAFQLEYDLGDFNTQEEWSAYVQLTLKHPSPLVPDWSAVVRVDMIDQIFVSTVFYSELVSCFDDYQLEFTIKNLTGSVPEENIHLKVLLHRFLDEPFDPFANLEVDCSMDGSDIFLGWNFHGSAVQGYELEWVAISPYDGFDGSSPEAAFAFKEGIRVSIDKTFFVHSPYYPDMNLYYRLRAIGYNPEFPDYKIPGKWEYFDCAFYINNHNPDINWQQQITYAEGGKNKKVMSYYDGSLRQRQVQTNLSTEDVTLVAENLYDYEGRMSATILPAPAVDNHLVYRNGFHRFQALNPTIGNFTSDVRRKFHYDNQRLENSILSNEIGASHYYSSVNSIQGLMRDFIPDAEGYVMIQTEYLNDATGRVSRQSGVGETFKMDGTHATRYYYGEASQEELVRLFGSNVGKSPHYKKNLTIDPNGQISVSYESQEGQIIATALAGDPPANVEALESYEALIPEEVSANISHKNTIDGNSIKLVHHFLNTTADNKYTISYSMAALASDLGEFGCEGCTFDLMISLIDANGHKISIPQIAGNEATDNKSYLRRGLSVEACEGATELQNLSFEVFLIEIGNYTLVKELKVYERSFEEWQSIVLQEASIIQEIEQVQEFYNTAPSDCEFCFEEEEPCSDVEDLIGEAMESVAMVNCENILNQILDELGITNDLVARGGDNRYSEEIQAHELFCQYLLCSNNELSDVFEMQLAGAKNWTEAVENGYQNSLDMDPFFNMNGLNGFGYKENMQLRLNNILIATISWDSNGDGIQDAEKEYRGSLLEVTDPENTEFYVDPFGRPSASGRHILYLDLMARRQSMGEEAYQREIDNYRWILYRSFYLEAKRAVKMNDITAYGQCPAAMEQLGTQDNLPKTVEGFLEWGEEFGGQPVSNAELEMTLSNLSFVCNVEFSDTDEENIFNHLEAYFNSNTSNFYRLILEEDLGVDENLIAIENILQNYNCLLSSVALENPLVCLREETILLPVKRPKIGDGDGGGDDDDDFEPFFLLGGVETEANEQEKEAVFISPFQRNIQISQESMHQEQARMVKLDEEVPSGELHRQQRRDSARNAYLAQKDYEMDSIRNAYRLQMEEEVENSQMQSIGSRLAMPMMMTLTQPHPSQEEYQALVDLFNSTNGQNWSRKNGWVDENGHIRPIETVSEWFGVLLNSSGNVIRLSLGMNNLEGEILPSINGLSHIEWFLLNNNKISQLPINFGQGWSNAQRIFLRYNQLEEIPDDFGQGWSSVQIVDLEFNRINKLPAEFGQGWSSVKQVYLNYNELQSLTSDFGLGWSNVNRVDLSFNLLNDIEVFGQDWSSIDEVFLNSNRLTSLPSGFGNGWSSVREVNLDGNQLTSLLPNFGQGWSSVQKVQLNSNQLRTLPDRFGQGWSSVQQVNLNSNELSSLPDEFGPGWSNLQNLSLLFNQLNVIPEQFGQDWINIRFLNLNYNQLSSLPEGFGQGWNNLYRVEIEDNQLVSLPEVFGSDWSSVHSVLLDYNQLSSLPQGFGQTWSVIFYVRFSNNNLDFSSLINAKNDLARVPQIFQYFDQSKVDVPRTVLSSGETATLSTEIDRNTNPASKYLWYKVHNGNVTPLQADFSVEGHTLEIPVNTENLSATFYYEIVNDELPDLILQSHMITLDGFEDEIEYIEFTYCVEYDYNNPTLASFTYNVDWNQVIAECQVKEGEVRSLLIDRVTERIVEERVTELRTSFGTNCLQQVNEQMNISYTNKEFHYTLYYYDQSNSLVQTVPPRGVNPLTNAQVTNFLAGNKTEPQHELVTRYRYNSLNQLIGQHTPDAGESKFWYNDLGQLRLSQNAQQVLDGRFSYSRYDVLGRIIEVGEMESSANGDSYKERLNNMNFPEAAEFALYDLTRTHYDFADANAPEGFVQEHLRNRVAWTEAQAADGEYTTTWYSYDVHGNVKSLMQAIPGMDAKRTDYRYDLVSGNVNYVFYQEGHDDAFIHHYQYDADNRIKEVYTSTDGYIWNKEARYNYYQHGPLARTELGNYRVQGLDYFYTLQGWLKGVNMPHANDPGGDGNTVTGADAFAFTLGYFPGDFKPINSGMQLIDQYSADLWNGNEGTGSALYNGNIAWMITDLPALGLQTNDRKKGLQAMQYRYDQLNRIKKAHSLTNFDLPTGFIGRSMETNPYDVSYSYDGNGNLLHLKRLGQDSEVQDEFDYQYYEGTNKLRSLQQGEGITYEYDAIGNLIMDHEEGTAISWTPYGKVRSVHKAADNTTIHFRYDATGNRIEKRVEKDGETSLTRYVRDASGNVMAVYRGEEQAEWHLYGSSRLGMGRGKSQSGQLKLGLRSYELSNHLGNVLAVITDNVNMSPDTEASQWHGSKSWATVLNTSDYYPFGLQMEGRSTSLDGEYRYGFNGKEKDTDFANHYDYGFRIYNPRIAKFLSVDPKAAEMPEWSPYSFSFNNPLVFIDPDGQKPIPVTSRQFRQFANSVGIYGNQQIGSYFERLSIASLQTTRPVMHNTTQDFFSPARQRMNGGLPASVRPDGISAYLGASSRGETFISPSFYEAKATSATLTKRYRKGQITGMIDALANMDRRPNEMASLTLVTTADTKISADILEYATSRRVVVFQSVAALDDETGEFILSEKTLLNGNGISTLIDQLRKLNGRYDEFNGVNPLNYLNGNNPGPGDPDPATIEDR